MSRNTDLCVNNGGASFELWEVADVVKSVYPRSDQILFVELVNENDEPCVIVSFDVESS